MSAVFELKPGILATDEELGALASQLQQRLCGRVRNFRLVRLEDGLVLHGRTNSYYAKQLAQHAVMSATDCPIYGNEIVVD